jgi:hypothetical protein
VAQEGQPRGPADVRFRSVVTGENPSNHVLVDGDGESQGNLLSDARAASGGIALLGGDDRINEFFGGTLGTGLTPAFRGEKQAVLALVQDLVKVQKGQRPENDGGMDQAGGAKEESTQADDEAIGGS